MGNLKKIRNQILRDRGLLSTKDTVSSHSHIVSKNPTVPIRKTNTMMLIELRHHMDIVDILSSGSLNFIQKKYGIDRTTASRWRKLVATELLKQISPSFYNPNPQFAKEATLGNNEANRLPQVDSTTD